ncbi:hypothetical protein K8I28_05110 [bacterium]|nr:hypothetical protein [bacterium]
MKKIILLLLCGALFAGYVLAQPPRHHRKQVRERVQTVKMLKLTESLELTEEQSIRFFPRFKKYEAEIDSATDQVDDAIETLRLAIESGISDKELTESMAEIETLIQRRENKIDQLIHGFDDILSVQQQAKLLVFQHVFPMKMREIIDDMRGGPEDKRGRGRGPGGGW